MADIRVRITGDNQDIINALRQVTNNARQAGNEMRNAGSSGGGLLSSLSQATVLAAGLVASIVAAGAALEKIVMPGFNFTKDMEQNELGLAGIIQSMTLLNGHAVSFSEAMQISDERIVKLQRDGLKTGATMKELVTVYRAVLAPGLGAGMDMDQIQKITTLGANAVKAILPGSGKTEMQLVQEMRDLVQGGITAGGSTLATSLQITDADITKAKSSAEGLFVFLNEKLSGFADVSKAFPDTLTGKLDNLGEVAEIASSKITEAFSGEIKDAITWLIGLFGELNTDVGKLEINPRLLSVIDEVKSGFQEIKDYASDVAPAFAWIGDSLMPALGSVWKIVKNVASAVLDLSRIFEMASTPLRNFVWQGVKDLLAHVALLSDYIKDLFDFIARKSGAKPSASGTKSWADQKRDDDTNTKPPIDSANITSKYTKTDDKKEVEASQEALKRALDAIKTEAEKTKVDITQAIQELNNSYALTGDISLLVKKAELERQLQQLAVERLENSLAVVQGAKFDKDNTKETKVQALQNDLEVAVAGLAKFDKAVAETIEVTNGISTIATSIDNPEGSTWRRETSNVNTDGLNDDAKQAISVLSEYASKLLGEQMTVSSGLRTGSKAGGHISGSKFDVVDSSNSTTLEDNKDGIRDKIVEYARSIGLKVADAYAGDEGPDADKHLDINAAGFTPPTTQTTNVLAQQWKLKYKSLLSTDGIAVYKAHLALLQEYDSVTKGIQSSQGNAFNGQRAEIQAKYGEIINKFQINNMGAAAESAKQLQKFELLRVDYAQANQQADYGTVDVDKAQAELVSKVTAGNLDIAVAVSKLNSTFGEKLSPALAQLEQVAIAAQENNNEPLLRETEDKIKSIKEHLKIGIDALVGAIDSALQLKLADIDSNMDLTTGQKADQTAKANREAAFQKVQVLQGQLDNPNLTDIDKQALKNALAAAEQLSNSLEKMNDITYRVGITAKQSFEDGLTKFLSEGVTQCRTLGEAFRQMASSIVASIQKVYAEAVAKDIMKLLGMTDKRPTVDGKKIQGPMKADGSFAEGGHIESGLVQGPGTSVSDSIVARIGNLGKFINISDGEFVMKGKAVRSLGVSALNALNNGINPRKLFGSYANGGSLAAAGAGAYGNRMVAGPQAIAGQMLSNNNTTSVPLKIINVSDPDQVGRYMSSRPGEKVMLNFIKNNSEVVKRMIGVK